MNEYDPPTATNVGTRVTTYAYDTERKPTLITRPDGQTIDFDYDTVGRLSTLNLPSGQVTYGYNPTTGNLASITDSTGSSLAYTYDGSLPKRDGRMGSHLSFFEKDVDPIVTRAIACEGYESTVAD